MMHEDDVDIEIGLAHKAGQQTGILIGVIIGIVVGVVLGIGAIIGFGTLFL